MSRFCSGRQANSSGSPVARSSGTAAPHLRSRHATSAEAGTSPARFMGNSTSASIRSVSASTPSARTPPSPSVARRVADCHSGDDDWRRIRNQRAFPFEVNVRNVSVASGPITASRAIQEDVHAVGERSPFLVLSPATWSVRPALFGSVGWMSRSRNGPLQPKAVDDVLLAIAPQSGCVHHLYDPANNATLVFRGTYHGTNGETWAYRYKQVTRAEARESRSDKCLERRSFTRVPSPRFVVEWSADEAARFGHIDCIDNLLGRSARRSSYPTGLWPHRHRAISPKRPNSSRQITDLSNGRLR